MRRRLWSSLPVVAGLLVVLTPRTVSPFCTRTCFIFCDCGGEGHEAITETALNFLPSCTVNRISDGNVNVDDSDETGSLPEWHFTDCRFGTSVEVINETYADIIAHLDPAAPDSQRAVSRFGRLLHPIQDFYSHSNWIDPIPIGVRQAEAGTGPNVLLDAGLGLWSVGGGEPFEVLRFEDPHEVAFPDRDPITVEGVVLVHGAPPPGVTVDYPLDATKPHEFCSTGIITGTPETVLPIVTKVIDGREVHFKGLMTATTCAALAANGNDCPPPTQVAHNKDCGSKPLNEHCFNHDREDRPRHTQTFNAATYQTQHEWCRLLHLLQSSHGYDAASIPLALWTAFDDHPLRSPHPRATPCERDPRGGPVEVNVRVEELEFLRDVDVPVLSYVLYRGDFRDSHRALSLDDQPGGDTGLTLCVGEESTVVATVWGWEESLSPLPLCDVVSELDGRFSFDPVNEDTIKGVTVPFTADGTEVLIRRSAGDLSVSFAVSYPVVDVDADGLSRCAEFFYGTGVNNPDTDGDGLLDGAEVNVHGTDPLVPDSDGDGLSDGDEVLTYGTDPKNSDTDGDGLSDGQEVTVHLTDPLAADTDGDGLNDGEEVLEFGTDPLNPDTDGDKLPDGVEVASSTDPLNPDTDGDGIIDGEDVEFIENGIAGVPASSFRTAGNRNATLTRLGASEKLVALGRRDSAILVLCSLRETVNGCGSGPDVNDWILTCPDQLTVRGLLDQLIVNLGGNPACLPPGKEKK